MHRSSKTVDDTVISGPQWFVVSAAAHHSPSATSAADTTNRYRLLIVVCGVGGDFTQIHRIRYSINIYSVWLSGIASLSMLFHNWLIRAALSKTCPLCEQRLWRTRLVSLCYQYCDRD